MGCKNYAHGYHGINSTSRRATDIGGQLGLSITPYTRTRGRNGVKGYAGHWVT